MLTSRRPTPTGVHYPLWIPVTFQSFLTFIHFNYPESLPKNCGAFSFLTVIFFSCGNSVIIWLDIVVNLLISYYFCRWEFIHSIFAGHSQERLQHHAAHALAFTGNQQPLTATHPSCSLLSLYIELLPVISGSQEASALGLQSRISMKTSTSTGM